LDQETHPQHLCVNNHPKWTRFGWILIALSMVAHMAYVWLDCPLDISQDEAHYWDWSRHLDWSYYSKGPLVAWIIWLNCQILGPLAEQTTGSLMPAVRTSAILFGGLLLFGIQKLATITLNSSKLGYFVVVIAVSLPPLHASSILMTIDAPFACLWTWALVTTSKALIHGPGKSAGWWITSGLLVGLGILAKYTMVIFPASLFLAMITLRPWRSQLLTPGPWLAALTAVICCIPIIVWNYQNSGVTFLHVSSLAGVSNSNNGFQWFGPFRFLGGQAALLLIFWFIAWGMALTHYITLPNKNEHIHYLLYMSLTIFLIFFVFSPKTGGGEINWPITAYIAGLPLVVKYIYELHSQKKKLRIVAIAGSITFALIGTMATLAMLYSSTIYGVLTTIVGKPNPENLMPLRRIDPTCRLKGWRTLTKQIDLIREKLGDEQNTILCGNRWSTTGVLGFYCLGHPQAYSLGPVLGDRHSQYDLWKNPFNTPDFFRNKNFIVVDGTPAVLIQAFDHVEVVQTVVHFEEGQPIARWNILICRGFKGFPADQLGKQGW